MGNCCAGSSKVHEDSAITQNPFLVEIPVLSKPTGGNDIGAFYDLGHELGHGGFGITYVCTERSTGKRYACKLISKKKLRSKKPVRTEVAIMQCLPKHPNIVTLKDTFEDESAVHLVMELCEGGDLADRIKARGHYTEKDAVLVAKSIVEVVQWCHKHGVMHRDLKLQNILFSNKEENSPLKVIDFGLSAFFQPGERFDGIVGSLHYMAPELLARNYGSEIDIWSAGVLIYIILSGLPPFTTGNLLESAVDFSKDPWPTVSGHAKDLVKQMLEPDPKKRLTAQEILDHPWLRNAEEASEVSVDDSSYTVFHSEEGKGKRSEE